MEHVSITRGFHGLFQGAKLQFMSRGEVVYSSDSPPKLYLLTSGFIKQYFISNSGDRGVQNVYGPDDLFPFSTVSKVLFTHDVFEITYYEPYFYEAITDIRFCAIDKHVLRKRSQANQLVYHDLLFKALERFAAHTQFLKNLRLTGAYRKIAHQLAHFGYQFGEEVRLGIRIKLPLRHQDIADIVGTTRETATTSIIKLRNKKLIKTDDRCITILDINKLLQEAYS